MDLKRDAAGRSRTSDAWPLRVVVARWHVPGHLFPFPTTARGAPPLAFDYRCSTRTFEELVCGHVEPTHKPPARKRRCRECAGLPPLPSPNPKPWLLEGKEHDRQGYNAT